MHGSQGSADPSPVPAAPQHRSSTRPGSTPPYPRLRPILVPSIQYPRLALSPLVYVSHSPLLWCRGVCSCPPLGFRTAYIRLFYGACRPVPVSGGATQRNTPSTRDERCCIWLAFCLFLVRLRAISPRKMGSAARSGLPLPALCSGLSASGD